jgi:hypothetical protein
LLKTRYKASCQKKSDRATDDPPATHLLAEFFHPSGRFIEGMGQAAHGTASSPAFVPSMPDSKLPRPARLPMRPSAHMRTMSRNSLYRSFRAVSVVELEMCLIYLPVPTFGLISCLLSHLL